MSIPKTGTSSLYGMINELPLEGIEEAIRSTAEVGRLGDHEFTSVKTYNFYSHGHFSYRDWLQYIEAFPIYKEFMTFSFVRNPYDRMLSIYLGHTKAFDEFMLPLSASRGKRLKVRTPPVHRLKKGPWSWSKRNDGPIPAPILKRFQTQTYYLIDDNGQIGVDFVGRLENLKEDYEKLRSLNPLLPKFDERYHLKKSKREFSHYEEYYDEETKEAIYDTFKEDFINFGYEK